MKRREFIPIACKAFLAFSVTGSLLSGCSALSVDLDEVIGQSVSILGNKKTEYEGEICCYSLQRFKSAIPGEKAFIFCQDDKIIGFSVKIKPSSSLPMEFQSPENSKIAFDNAFGTKITWQEGSVNKSLTTAKKYEDIISYTFYSVYADEAEYAVL